MGFDRAGTSTQHPADRYVDWTNAEQVRHSHWMYGFKTAAKAQLKLECQGFHGILVAVCIKGGPITDVEQEETVDVQAQVGDAQGGSELAVRKDADMVGSSSGDPAVVVAGRTWHEKCLHCQHPGCGLALLEAGVYAKSAPVRVCFSAEPPLTRRRTCHRSCALARPPQSKHSPDCCAGVRL